MVAGTFASVPCESVRERGRGRRPARDTSKPHAARQQPAAAAHRRLDAVCLSDPASDLIWPAPKAGVSSKGLARPQLRFVPILIARALLGDTGSHACALYVKGCCLHQTPMQPIPWTQASVARCAAVAVQRCRRRTGRGARKPWAWRGAGRAAAGWLTLLGHALSVRVLSAARTPKGRPGQPKGRSRR